MSKAAQFELFKAIQTLNLDGITAALAAGADPNFVDENGNTPLIRAMLHRNVEILRRLIDGGAEINPANPSLNPLDVARTLHLKQSAAFLEANGARPTLPPETPAEKDLYLAARTGKLALLQTALAGGANLDRVFGSGTALCHAIYRGHDAMVQLLLKAGASPDVTDNEGNNLARAALEDAQNQPHFERMQALLRQLAPDLVNEPSGSNFPRYNIDDILKLPDPGEVVNQLHGVLKSHQGELREHEIMFLAAQEAKCQIPWNGLSGWFNNLTGGSAVFWAIRGLDAIGAPQAATVVRQSLAVFPNSQPPDDYASFEECVVNLSPEQHALLDGLDSDFYDVKGNLTELSYRWLVANRQLFKQAD